MKKILFFFLIFLVFAGIVGCKTIVDSTKPSYLEYLNDDLNISFVYPSHWKADERMPYLGSSPSHYFGKDGFFAVNVISSDGFSLEDVAGQEAKSGDYGSNPQIRRLIHNAKIGFLVLPSNDQLNAENQRSCFITELRTIYRANRVNYDILFLFADQPHLMDIVDSLESN